jgi:uncharacterized protein (DUF924 family)
MDHAREVLKFWFGKLPLASLELEERMDVWFAAHSSAHVVAERDAAIRAQFGPLLARAAQGELDSWATSPRRLLALILVFDQFSRNAYRGTARAYAYDHRALGLALSGMQLGADAALDAVERIFFYMPLQHAESREVQDESIAAFRRLLAEAPADLQPVFASTLSFAQRHHDIVQRFGRFPHRNAVLGRLSSPEEQAYLQSAGDAFGQ